MTTDARVEGLHKALEGTFDLYRATHLAHWNVRGPQFPQLHLMFETQYNELWNALDAIAERVRALGAMVSDGALTATDTQVPADAAGMVSALAKGNRRLAETLRAVVKLAADEEDDATADLATQRIVAHEQAAWMLEATIA